ncbi:MAG: hypothetical protein ACXVXZ_13645 [Mycobacteriaceae bacterium]
MTLTQDRSANIRWWVVAGAQAQRNREVLRRLKLDKDRIVADTARAALDGLRLYRRLLELKSIASCR